MTTVVAEKCKSGVCDRDAEIMTPKPLCRAHYNQQWAGREFTPIRTYKFLAKDANGRVCTRCERYKTWENFYKRTNKGYQARCKDCMIAEEQDRQAQRLERNIACLTEGCEKPAITKGLCGTCYGRDYYERTKNK